MEKRVFIVSSRLPITIEEDSGTQQASGGLVTAINSYLNKEQTHSFDNVYWCGIPGCSLNTWVGALKNLNTTSFTYLPVFVPEKEYEGYYNGHSNSLLWPLFHYFPSYAEYNLEFYDHYQRVNAHFSETLLKHLHPSDTVWIHDYHLLPLAGMLRNAMPDLTIGFFLHIPFPSFEIFRLLPRKWQEDALKGMLGADLIGFHTIDYAAHFLQSVLMILGLDNERHVICHDNRLIKVDVFPISVDFEKFHNSFDNEKVTRMRNELRMQMNERKIIISIDRLDYTKGVQNRLRAYEYFLQQNPEYHGKVVFIMVIVPSRDTIPKYAERKRMIDELISRINSRVGNIHWVPVIYQYSSLGFEEMVSLYTASDLALITPLRDGMNLVSKEFVASRKDKNGVLILSEMAGAARELTDALLINPNDVIEIARKIGEGLNMELAEQVSRMDSMQRRIINYDVSAWASDFMSELEDIKNKQALFQVKFVDEYSRKSMYDAYRTSGSRLLLLDYDGTLVSFQANPDAAMPGHDLLQLLKHLGETEKNELYLISGRSSGWLEKHFGKLSVNLVAEHGARIKWKNEKWVTEAESRNEWKEQVHSIMEMHVRRCANTFIEEKDFSMVWHYRNANIDQGKLRAFELANDLHENIHSRNLQVLMGNKIVEVRQTGINKGNFIKKILAKKDYDFMFAAGDDRTDEDMFRALANRSNAFTIKIGQEASYAKYNLHTPQMIISLLEGFRYTLAPLIIQ